MKGNKYLSLKAICPHYKSEEKHMIYCRGIQKDTSTHIAFAFPADKLAYKEKFCESRYKECKILKMLEE